MAIVWLFGEIYGQKTALYRKECGQFLLSMQYRNVPQVIGAIGSLCVYLGKAWFPIGYVSSIQNIFPAGENIVSHRNCM